MTQQTAAAPEHFDVLIVGAGISGIDAAYHLTQHRPGTRFAILESQAALGGTWHTHTFPGIRSDSDLFTFGFSWKPWTGLPIAQASDILAYLQDAVSENDLEDKIRFGCSVEAAQWSSADSRWTLTLRAGPDHPAVTMTCGFLWMCAGYYRHSEGFTPDWPGMDRFEGPIVHPQTWPDTLDHAGKEVIVIGSGATAATLVPALTRTTKRVTMIQRSPTFYFPRPMMDEFSETLSALGLPDEWYHEIMRRKFLHENELTARRAREEPDALAQDLMDGAKAYLGDEIDFDTHFKPTYRAWRQRIAMVPDGDLFVALRDGAAEIVTDTIAQFVPEGVQLSSGQHVRGDIIVTATGLNLNMFGDIDLAVDGQAVDIPSLYTHRGAMFSDLPNFVTVFGYLRSSWTLRADLLSSYVCRLLDHMDAKGAASVTPRLRAEDQDMQERPWVDPENFNPGYLMRSLGQLPRQGDKQPWIMTQDYYQDRDDLPVADLDDGTLIYQ